MVRLNKYASKNMLKAIVGKSTKLFTATPKPRLTMKEYDTIVKICERAEKRLK